MSSFHHRNSLLRSTDFQLAALFVQVLQNAITLSKGPQRYLALAHIETGQTLIAEH